MTTKRSVGRPPRAPPWAAAERIEKLASEGWTVRGIAKTLGTDKDTLHRLMEDHPELHDAFEAGREKERHALHNALYKAAMRGQIAAAMFLLKCRHPGYNEQGPSDAANKVAITFNLPAAMSVEQFVVENRPDAVALPAARPHRP